MSTPGPPVPPALAAGSPWALLMPALSASYSVALARIRAQILAAVLHQFRFSGSWREHDAAEFMSIVPPLVRGGQQAVSAITAGYVDRVTSEATGVTGPPVGISPSEVTGSAVRGGVDPAVVYRRPYATAWTDLAAGAPLPQALTKAERRIVDLVDTDLQLAKTNTVKKVGERNEKILGWRRIPQGTYSCALCLITATMIYHRRALLPIHPNCNCSIEPITLDYDPLPAVSEQFLADVHAAIERDLGAKYVAASGRLQNTKARELFYRDIVIVHEHGEIGGVLGVRGQTFTGPEDIPRLGRHQEISKQVE